MSRLGDRLPRSEGIGEVGGRRRLRSRWWWALGAAAAIGFLVMLTLTTERAAVPVGASAGTPAMAMGGASTNRLDLTVRDTGGRPLRIPDGRPGVAVFVQASGCRSCVQAVRTAARAIAQTRPAGVLVVVAVDSSTSRSALAAFARSAGGPPARYVVDDSMSTLANAFGASTIGDVVAYNKAGQIVERTGAPVSSELVRALTGA